MGDISCLTVEEGDDCSGYMKEVDVDCGDGHKEGQGSQKNPI
jgi:hypothetical protein